MEIEKNGHTFSSLKLELELEAKKTLAEVKEEKIKKLIKEKKELTKEKKELVKKNEELLAIINVEKVDKKVGPDVKFQTDRPFISREGEQSSITEARWTIDTRTMALQTEMGDTSTLRAREKVTGDNKQRARRWERTRIRDLDREGRAEGVLR